MSSSSSSQKSRRAVQSHAPRRRPLARSNSSLLGTIKNIVTAPLSWFGAPDEFDDSPDLKGKRRRNATVAMDDSDGLPRTKRLRVKSPDSQIQFHPEPQYVAPPYPSPPTAYLDPPEMVFSNPQPHSSSVTASFNRTGLFRTMSIDPPHNLAPLSRQPSMNLDRDSSMERAFSAIPRDLSMPLSTTRNSIRLRTSLTPQPIAREVSEPPSLSVLAQKPVFVRAPTESHHRLSSQSSTSTLGSLVESQRRTRSPMRQHSSLLFGSGTQEHEASTARQPTRQPAPAERALHELDVYRTPLLPTRSRLRASASSLDPASHSGDASDLFRPRRASQLLLMRDDKRASRLGQKGDYSFLESEKPQEKEGKKVNETKPYAGEGGMKKLLARRMKEVEEEEGAVQSEPPKSSAEPPKTTELAPTLPPPFPSESPWTIPDAPPPAASGSSLRVGRTKTSRNHIARPARPTKKFSAAYEEENDDNMDDAEELERQKERQELEEAAKKLPTFNIPTGFSFAKELNAKPPIADEADAKEPPIAALPFSFGKPLATAPSAPTNVLPADPPPKPPSPAFSFGPGPDITAPTMPTITVPTVKEKVEERTDKSSGGIPNFFGSSKASALSSLLPSSFGLPGSSSSPFVAPSVIAPAEPIVTPRPSSSLFPATPAPTLSAAPSSVPTPIRDVDNPFWVGDASNKASLFSTKEDSAPKSTLFGGPLFNPPSKPDVSTPVFGGPTPTSFSFTAPTPTMPTKVEEGPKPSTSLGLLSATPTAPVEAPTTTTPFSFSTAPPPTDAPKPADAPKPFSFGPSSFASTVVPEPPFGGGFTFEQPVKEPPKSTPAPSTFTFGAPATTTAVDVAAKPSSAPFSFGATSTPASTSTFSFAASDPKPSFSFGTPTMPAAARPVTPPRNEVPEFKMDESPTRELVSAEAKAAESRPSLGGPAFSFGNPASGSIFGAPAPAAPSLFSFGSPTAANPNTFSSAASPAENKPFGSTDFGRPSSSSSNPFGFGQNTTNAEPARPATSFSFGAPTSSTGTFNAFGSGTPTTTIAPSNPFGGSAPSSPSTFSQPFSFGASPAAAPFAFGASQPASPAGSVSSLPQPSTPGGFGASPSFASGGGGGLFTIGAAPAPQARQMKKLPRRKN